MFGRDAAARRPRHRLPAAGAHRAAGSARARPRLYRQFGARRTLGRAARCRAPTARRSRKRSPRSARAISPSAPLAEMSGGERQRLLLAQALLGEPQLLLLDEPLISLDHRYQEAVVDLVRGFARERNITVLFSAHELNQLIGALDRVLYLGNGHAALGTVRRSGDRAGAVEALRRADRRGATPAATFSCCRAAATSNAPTICTIMVHDHGHAHDHGIITAMLEYDFMRNAFAAAGVAAIVSGVVGYFLVLRGQTFAGHALGHIGFAGATGAVLIGLAPLWGLIGFTRRRRHRHGAAGRAAQRPRCRHRRRAGAGARLRPVVPALLHGVRRAGDGALVRQRACGRPRHDRDARGAWRRHARGARRDHAAADLLQACSRNWPKPKACRCAFVSVAFLAIVALAVSESAQIVGVLLVFALMVGPPATAQRLASGLWSGHCAVGRHCARRGVARHRHRLLHRLAGQLLHLASERARLLPDPIAKAHSAGHGRARTGNHMSETGEKSGAICVGEAVIELKRGADGRFALSCGGDTFNTAIYLARAGINVTFATALGDDPYSESMMALASAEGISSNLMLRVPGQLPALCLVENGPDGERRARYWRDSAPVRVAVRAARLDAARRRPDDCQARVFFRHHAVAVFQHRAWPLSRRARSGAPAGYQGGVRRQFPAARLERRPAAHTQRVHRNAQARRYRAADIRRRGGAVGRSESRRRPWRGCKRSASARSW